MTKAKTTIRSVADRLGDARPSQRAWQGIKEQEHREAQAALNRFRVLWRADPHAVIAEETCVCVHCGATLEPRVLDAENPRRPKVPGTVASFPQWRNADQFVPNWLEPEQWAQVPADRIRVIRRTSCGCKGEQAALAQEKEISPVEWGLRLTEAGLIGDLADMTLETYGPRNEGERAILVKVIEYTKALIEGRLGGDCFLILHGGYGLGKTHLAAGALQKALKYDQRGFFRVWPDWLDRLRNSFNGRGDPGQITAELKLGQVVVIDDIDKQHPTESGFPEEKLFIVLNDRANHHRPTILTFNRPPDEMVPWLGEAAVDRVLQRAFASLKFTGKSYRSGKQWME